MPLNELRLPLSLNITNCEAERHNIFLKSSP
ncbi:hypothetical protein T4A_2386 [Trichinella pseudospiralis]|uniref:Uncharacterized protein n=1 Tax=Trichinella pseudospiralis TaxID=6337 RepID=A0A0V1AKD2_TRIPS|nr:hypothetical protein T4A_2386 [Trichinella pseudospiralis]